MGRHNVKAPADPAAKALNEAAALQQRGERREGQDALTCFEKAAGHFREALAAGLPNAEQHQEAVLGLAEVLQQAASTITQVAETLPDVQLTHAVEDEARCRAAALYAQSVETYLQSRTADGRVTAEASVNCANVLCSWAELVQEAHSAAAAGQLTAQAQSAVQGMTASLGVVTWSAQHMAQMQAGGSSVSAPQVPATPSSTTQQEEASCALLDCACGLYCTALAQEEDALTLSNLGDALMSCAQALWSLGRRDQATRVTHASLEAYNRSCSMSHSDEGDDLPGLLTNWGVGLTHAAEFMQDVSVRREMLTQAEQRLRSAAEFTRADPAPLIGLGDALVAHAELLAPTSSGSTQHTAGATAEAASKLQCALSDGYGGALRIQRDNCEALVGAAEAHLALARLAQGAGDSAAAQSACHEAIVHYEAALRLPHKLPGFKHRCETRYNLACCLALSGADARSAELLSQLLACGGVTREDIAQDADLHEKPWVAQLLQATT